jgi:hypothetical protein
MSRNGSGTYQLPAGNPVVSGTTISSTVHNNTMSDIASALTASIAKDGQTTATANLPMGGFRHTSVGNATARSQYGTVDQIQDGEYIVVGSVAGTNTITGSLSPSITAYVAGMQVVLIPANANTGATTLNLNSVGALDVQKYTSAGQVALAANDLRAGIPALLVLDTGSDDWILLNPYSGSLGDVTVGTLTATTINASGAVTSANGTPQFVLTESDAAANNKNWLLKASAEQLLLQAGNDALGSFGTIMTVDRTANTIDSIALTATSITVNGADVRSATDLFNTGTVPAARLPSSFAGLANSTGTVTLSAANGSNATASRSDHGHALDQSIAPTWTAPHTFSNSFTSGNPGAAVFSASIPMVEFDQSGATANNRRWWINAASEQLQFQVANDARNTSQSWLVVDRTGTTVDSVALPSEVNGAFRVGTYEAALNGSRLVARTATASAGAAQFVNQTAGTSTIYIHNQATAGDNVFAVFITESGAIGTTRGSIDFNRGGGALRYNITSDERLKKNFKVSGSAIDLVMQIAVESFDWIESGNHVEFGYVAQHLHRHFPDAVSTGDVWQVDRSSLVPVLHRALQEVHADLQRHKAKVAKALAALMEE